MTNEIPTDFVDIYIKWVKENIDQFQINSNTYRISMPFLDRNNDYVEFYIIRTDSNKYILTDEAATINDLFMCGFDIQKNSKRERILKSIVESFGVNISDDYKLTVDSTLADIPQRKHMLAQCMMKVSDLFYLSRSNVKSLFYEDVKNYLDQNEVFYMANISFIGKSRLTTQYDFGITRSKNAPERLIKVVNKLDKDAARNVIFAWNDTKDMRPEDAHLYTFIQDEDMSVSGEAIDALVQYDIKPALWSKRGEVVRELVA